MDERHLLLLGLLLAQSRHGYEINEFIEHNMGRVSNMKRATAYALLDRMHRAGLVRMSTRTVGNRPPRKEYSITEEGRKAFYDLVRRGIAAADDAPQASDIAIMFLDCLPTEESISLLQARDQNIAARIAALRRTPKHAPASGVDLSVERSLALLEAERAWLESVIDKMKTSRSDQRKDAMSMEKPRSEETPP